MGFLLNFNVFDRYFDDKHTDSHYFRTGKRAEREEKRGDLKGKTRNRDGYR